MLPYLINLRPASRRLSQLLFVVLSLFLVVKIGYSSNTDQLCRLAPMLTDGLEASTDGLTELGSACYGSGESLKIRVIVAISPDYEDLVNEKLHFKDLLKSFCEIDELYKLARQIPIVWTYYTMDGAFHSQVYLNVDLCDKNIPAV
ncbi:hypothetical protein N9V13_05720 [Betaproteobacteria bacterium]|nr:hypothetical protein [Betaproteobacteria bacterium]